jgi:hypothetical protein
MINKDNLKLVESFNELKAAMRVLVKNCRQHNRDCKYILISIETYPDGDIAWTTDDNGAIYKPDSEERFRRPGPPGNTDCISEKRLFRYVDFDENSQDEKIIKYQNKLYERHGTNNTPAKVNSDGE